MREKRNLICICCPLGCPLTVELENNSVVQISGNTCRRGEVYAKKEVSHPTRIVTSSVCVSGGTIPMVSVKTAQDIPKEKIMDIMHTLTDIQLSAPIHIGDCIVKNAAGTGVDIIATKEVPAL